MQANVKEVEDLIAELGADPDYAAQAAQAAELGVNLDDPDVPPSPLSFPAPRIGHKRSTPVSMHASSGRNPGLPCPDWVKAGHGVRETGAGINLARQG